MAKFRSFVMLAGMRTGSNLLEEVLCALPDVTCHGEAFNRNMLGHPRRDTLLGMDIEARNRDPMALWERIVAAPGLNGCRFFNRHDRRVLPAMLEAPDCAKIVLTRNPLDSYVSLKIARATSQWRLGDVTKRRVSRVRFDGDEFASYLAEQQDFQIELQRTLQVSGQSAFHISYEDLRDLEVLNGLARWLGVEARIGALPGSLVPQNPETLEEKVENFEEMEQELARIDRFDLSRTPNFEPRRGPHMPGFLGVGQGGVGLLHMAMTPAPEDGLRDWLGGLGLGAVQQGFSRRELALWWRDHPRHRSFSVLRHPLRRAQIAFEALLEDPQHKATRAVLRRDYAWSVPSQGRAQDLSGRDYQRGLAELLRWFSANLNGQTSLPVAPLWASQVMQLRGFAQIGAPDLLLREDELGQALPALAQRLGIEAPPPALACVPDAQDPAIARLARLNVAGLDLLAREAYRRDYLQFGFDTWQPPA